MEKIKQVWDWLVPWLEKVPGWVSTYPKSTLVVFAVLEVLTIWKL